MSLIEMQDTFKRSRNIGGPSQATTTPHSPLISDFSEPESVIEDNFLAITSAQGMISGTFNTERVR